MKINSIEINLYRKKHEKPILNGKYIYEATDLVTCKVNTDEGISGIGWTYDRSKVITGNSLRRMSEIVIGEDPFNVERIWSYLYLPKVFGRKGFAVRAMSCIDIACWDIMGKVSNRPLYQLLGGYREEVPVYVAAGYYGDGKTIEELKDEMKGKVEQYEGVKAVKIKIGRLSVKEDTKRIAAVREGVGDEVDILVDANNAYSRIDGLRMGKVLDDYNIFWFEEPYAPDDLAGAAELSSKIVTPIAAGENEYTCYGFRDMIDQKAVDIVNANPQILGGITQWKKIADYAYANHIPIAPHGDQEINMHLVAAVSNGLIVEYYDTTTNALRDKMFKEKVVLNKNGTLSPSKKPGLGVEMDFEALEPYKVESYTIA